MATNQLVSLLKGTLCTFLLLTTSNVYAEYYISDTETSVGCGGGCQAEDVVITHHKYHRHRYIPYRYIRRAYHRPSSARVSIYIISSPAPCGEAARICNDTNGGYVDSYVSPRRAEIIYDSPMPYENIGDSFGDSFEIGGSKTVGVVTY